MKYQMKTDLIHEVKDDDGTYYIDHYLFEDTLDGIISSLTNIKSLLSQYENLRFVIDSGHANIDVELYGDRPETEQERQQRLKFQKKIKDQKKINKEKDKEQRYKEYLKLHKEFANEKSSISSSSKNKKEKES